MNCQCGHSIFLGAMCAYCLRAAESRFHSRRKKAEEELSKCESSLDELGYYLEHRESQTPEEWDKEMSSKYGPGWRKQLGVVDYSKITVHSYENKTKDGLTLISIIEKDAEGTTLCSGCKKKDPKYSQMVVVDENTRKFYSVHKRCRARDENGEVIIESRR